MGIDRTHLSGRPPAPLLTAPLGAWGATRTDEVGIQISRRAGCKIVTTTLVVGAMGNDSDKVASQQHFAVRLVLG